AYTTKYYNRSVFCFGLGWLWLGPFSFFGTSDMWLSSRKERIMVDIAGIYFNNFLCRLASFFLLFLTKPIMIIYLWVFALTNYLTTIANLNTIIELDGYYVLMDLLDKPNLRLDSLEWLVKTFSEKKFKNAMTFWQNIQMHWQEAVYWLVTFLY